MRHPVGAVRGIYWQNIAGFKTYMYNEVLFQLRQVVIQAFDGHLWHDCSGFQDGEIFAYRLSIGIQSQCLMAEKNW